MTKFAGRRGELGIAVEDTRGTAKDPTFWVPHSTMSFQDQVEEAREEQGLGKITDSDSKYVTFKFGQGNVENQYYDKALGAILSSVFGSTPSSAGTDPTTHTYTVQNDNTHQSLSLYWTDPDRSYMFPLAVVNEFQISVSTDGIVNYTTSFMSRESNDWTQQTSDYTSVGSKFLHQHLELKLASDISSLSGANKISVKNLELNINNNTVHDNVLGTVSPEDVLNQTMDVNGSLELNLEDDTYRDYMLDGTYQAMEIFLNGASDSSLKFQLPRVDFSEWEPDYTLNEISTQTINFKGNYDKANDQEVISLCELVNNQGSY